MTNISEIKKRFLSLTDLEWFDYICKMKEMTTHFQKQAYAGQVAQLLQLK